MAIVASRYARLLLSGISQWMALDWNTDAHRFYEGLGAEMLPEWRVFRIHGDALSQLAVKEGG